MQNQPVRNVIQLHEEKDRAQYYLKARDITADPAFQFRHGGTDKAHVRGLVQTLRNVGDLDPILAWREVDETGTPTGRVILLDGLHRLAAYATVKPRDGVPTVVINGGREEALLEAVKANSRESLPWTKAERMDAAWRLVRLSGKRLTVPAVAAAAGVGKATVDRMRKRWKDWPTDGKEPTGAWWRDGRDDLPEMGDKPEMTDAERTAQIEQLKAALQEVLGKEPWRDEQLVAEALQAAIGTYKLRSMAVYLFGSDEFNEDPQVIFRETVSEPECATEQGDF